MRVVLFGATGMVGQGVLRECLRDPQVTRVLAVGRRPTGVSHPKLAELVRRDFHDWSDADDALAGYDACFFTLGVSAAGMSEADYTRTTYDLTLAAATTLARLDPGMTFIYVSGAGTDSTERGRRRRAIPAWCRAAGGTVVEVDRTRRAPDRRPVSASLTRAQEVPMYVLVQHTIAEPSAFWNAVDPTRLPAALKLHHTFPTPDGSHAACIWEAASAQSVREFLEGVVGRYSRNEYFTVENREGVAVPSGVERAAAARA